LEDDKLEFDRKIKRGAASDSYGIKIAEFVKIPKEITKRAYEIMKRFSLNGKDAEIVKEIAKNRCEFAYARSGSSRAR